MELFEWMTSTTWGESLLTLLVSMVPVIELRAPASVIGRNTRAAMQSGVVLGEVARVDGLLDAVMAELGQEAPVAITGDGASGLAPLLAHAVVVDNTLTLRGLYRIWAHGAVPRSRKRCD